MKLSTTTFVALFGFSLVTAVGAAGGCSGDSGGNADPSGAGAGAGAGAGGGGAGSGSPTGSTGSGFGDAGIEEDASLNEDSACVATKVQANYEQRPADIVFVIDNSGSMTDEIVSVQARINANFASIVDASGIDYRVLMLSEYGSAVDEQSVCIQAPLGANECLPPFGDAPTNNDPKFFHYNVRIDSLDSLCKVLDTLRGGVPDQNGAVPNGWIQWLRTDSLKVFVVITDDNLNCATTTLNPNVTLRDTGETAAEGTTLAEAFDGALLGAAPEFFGSTEERNYMFFSFVGLEDNMPVTAPWPPTEPVLEGARSQCNTAVGPGTGYQTLSVMTGVLRYPVCRYESYDGMFEAIANSVISGARLECDFAVPEPPAGQTIDLDTVLVEYTPSNGGEKQTFSQVPNAAECKPSSFYIEQEIIRLCPDTCVVARRDNSAQLSILYGCQVTAD